MTLGQAPYPARTNQEVLKFVRSFAIYANDRKLSKYFNKLNITRLFKKRKD